MVHEALCMMHDARWMMNHKSWMRNNEWWLMNDEWWMMHDAWRMIHDAWYMIHDAWSMTHDAWCKMKYEIWKTKNERWQITDNRWQMTEERCTMHDKRWMISNKWKNRKLWSFPGKTFFTWTLAINLIFAKNQHDECRMMNDNWWKKRNKDIKKCLTQNPKCHHCTWSQSIAGWQWFKKLQWNPTITDWLLKVLLQ